MGRFVNDRCNDQSQRIFKDTLIKCDLDTKVLFGGISPLRFRPGTAGDILNVDYFKGVFMQNLGEDLADKPFAPISSAHSVGDPVDPPQLALQSLFEFPVL
jgi:hypothetical protein